MLDLYILNSCSYCQKVMSFLNTEKIAYNKMDISDKNILSKLIEIGGKEQVPFLHDFENNIKLYESNEIIKYLEERL